MLLRSITYSGWKISSVGCSQSICGKPGFSLSASSKKKKKFLLCLQRCRHLNVAHLRFVTSIVLLACGQDLIGDKFKMGKTGHVFGFIQITLTYLKQLLWLHLRADMSSFPIDFSCLCKIFTKFVHFRGLVSKSSSQRSWRVHQGLFFLKTKAQRFVNMGSINKTLYSLKWFIPIKGDWAF